MTGFDVAAMPAREKAEVLAAWYLRFNGFFPLPNFILQHGGIGGQGPGAALTECDVLALRLPHAREIFQTANFGPISVQRDEEHGLGQVDELTDFVIAEVSSLPCKWQWLAKDPGDYRAYLAYCLRRLGQWQGDDEIDVIADLLAHSNATPVAYPADHPASRIRLVSIGRSTSELPIQQITFASILGYMQRRLFGSFDPVYDPDKRFYSDIKQWHPLIQHVYRELRPRIERTKTPKPEPTPAEVVARLFP